MTSKKVKKTGKVPFPHVCTKNVCYCYLEEGYYTVNDAIEVIENRYGGYPVRLVSCQEDLDGI